MKTVVYFNPVNCQKNDGNMPTPPSPLTLKARWSFPVESEPVSDGTVTIAGERIVSVGKPAGGRILDLGNVAILPGLINAHTHLEFSDLPAPLGMPGMSFPDWIRLVIRYRHEVEKGISPIYEDRPDFPRKLDLSPFAGAIDKGLLESTRAGTTAIGEIASAGWECPSHAVPADMTVFHELIGLAKDNVDDRIETARSAIAADRQTTSYRPALSPHAPYTVHAELFARLVALAKQQRVPLAFHLAESREELQLLRDHSGPFRDLLEELGVWNRSVFRSGTRPLDYLRLLAGGPRSLVIHGNYLVDDEIALLADHRDQMALVYCPRTHAYFGHERYPLDRLLAAGATVAIGTDSRASNPDLNLLAELRFMARRHPRVAPRTILELGTLGGARALGIDRQLGSLLSGKHANLAVVALPDDDAIDPYELLLGSETPVERSMFCGVWTD